MCQVRRGAPGTVWHSVPKTVPISWRTRATGGVTCCAGRLKNGKQGRNTSTWFAKNRERRQASNLTVMVIFGVGVLTFLVVRALVDRRKTPVFVVRSCAHGGLPYRSEE